GETPRSELPWLYTIAHNVCRTRRRALRRRSRVETPVDIDRLHDVAGRGDAAREDLAALGDSLAALPATQRRALLLREWHGLSYAEISRCLGLSQAAVETLLFRARRNLAKSLRAADRAASLTGLALVLRRLRRLASSGGSAKATTAAVAVTVAAGAGLQPLLTSPRRPATPSAPAGASVGAPLLRTASIPGAGHAEPEASPSLRRVRPAARAAPGAAVAQARPPARAPAVASAAASSPAAPATPGRPAPAEPDPGPPASAPPAGDGTTSGTPAGSSRTAAPPTRPSRLVATVQRAAAAAGARHVPTRVQAVVSKATASVQKTVTSASSVLLRPPAAPEVPPAPDPTEQLTEAASTTTQAASTLPQAPPPVTQPAPAATPTSALSPSLP